VPTSSTWVAVNSRSATNLENNWIFRPRGQAENGFLSGIGWPNRSGIQPSLGSNSLILLERAPIVGAKPPLHVDAAAEQSEKFSDEEIAQPERPPCRTGSSASAESRARQTPAGPAHFILLLKCSCISCRGVRAALGGRTLRLVAGQPESAACPRSKGLAGLTVLPGLLN
jgi:hypothetical protein